MEMSPYFLKAMYLDQSPSAADYFEERSPSLFVSDSLQSWLDFQTVDAPPQVERKSGKPKSSLRLHDSKSARFRARDHDNLWISDGPDGRTQRFEPGVELSTSHLRRVTHTDDLVSVVNDSEGKTRIFFVRQRNSFSRLSLTRSLFDCLLRECAIFAQIKDFAVCFGSKSGENEIAPPHIRIRSGSSAVDRMEKWTFECTYVLRFVELNHRGREAMPWSSRQFAVYHKFETVYNASTWVFIALSRRAQVRLDEYLDCCEDLAGLNPFEIHVLLLDTAVSNWRQYLMYLTTETNDRAARVIPASIDDESLVRVTEFTERQRLKQIDDDLLDVLSVLNSTLDTISSLRQKYLSDDLQQVLGCSNGSNHARDAIVVGLQQKENDVLLYRAKAENLRAKVAGTTELVSNLLDLGSGHSLKVLAEEARTENATMRELTERGYRDAVAIKILTIATLIYLPATVVSNFFSTQFVSQVTTPGSSSTRLAVASNWWIFMAASVPLTVITLYVWWFYVQKQAYGRYPHWFILLKKWITPITAKISRNSGRTQSGSGFAEGRELHDRLQYSPASLPNSNATSLGGLRSI